MNRLTPLAAAAGVAVASLLAAPPPAEAQHHRDRYDRYDGHPRDYRRAPRHGEFIVYAWLCPDLREDRRDRRFNEGWRDRREDRRDRRVLSCPPRAWEYVRGVRDRGRGPRFTPREAYWDPRSGRYFVHTRRGTYPVRVVYGRGFHQRWDDRRWQAY
jgi:hypothetical protein